MNQTTRKLFLAAALASALLGCGPETMETGEEVGAPEVEGASAAITSATRGQTIKANTGVNLRTGPSSAYSVILVVPYGATATVLNGTPNNGYFQIDYRGTVGWSYGTYWDAVPGLVVNGYTLSSTQDANIRWIAQYTVARLAGTRDQKLTVASRVAWWSLKEGVLDLSNPHPFSLCQTPTGPVRLGPTSVCGYSVWQAGIAGIQVYDHTLTDAENLALSLYPGKTVRDVLSITADYSGYPAGTSTYDAIVNSTGNLRRSWLERNHGVGFTMEEPVVTSQCINGSSGWCYNNTWAPSKYFAPDKSSALRSIGEIKAILDGLN